MSDRLQRVGESTSRDTRAAAGDDRAVECDTGIAKQPCQLFGAFQLAGARVGHVLIRDITATGDMTAAQTGPGFGYGAVKPAGGARIDDLLAPARQVLDQCPLVPDQRGVEPRREAALRRAR